MDRVVVCQGQFITTADALLQPNHPETHGQEFLAAVLTAALNIGEPVKVTGEASDTFAQDNKYEGAIRNIAKAMNCRFTLDLDIDLVTMNTRHCTLTFHRLK
ncbi:hypothetical protein C121_39 [Stenotrophomonas phage C121]|uniref:hypothetical protein n=1 Tax=Stenotrophomonas phage C121 TaxID=2914029 RepID=UPI00232952A2|nr:hypothetical protein PP752_gp39 [Stenotrophomonas phage C121]UKL14772.1 hypothetical protein C121_39 [Stenotrophomonas phage C121]